MQRECAHVQQRQCGAQRIVVYDCDTMLLSLSTDIKFIPHSRVQGMVQEAPRAGRGVAAQKESCVYSCWRLLGANDR